MSIEFRWQIESEEDEKKPALPPKRRRRVPWRLVGIALMLLVVGGGIAAGIFWQRVRQGEKRLRQELGTVVNLEVQALRDGDRETFFSLQDQDNPYWYNSQHSRFLPWLGGTAWLEPGQEANLAILEAALLPTKQGNHARAEVAWAMEDGIYRRTQFYRSEAGRWLRTGTRREYFDQERTRETAHFAFHYWTHDEPTVNWMAEQLETWYDAVCADLKCNNKQRISVLITPLEESDKEFQLPEGFVVSSPRLRGIREDGAPLPPERVELARILTHLLTVRQANNLEAWQQPYLLPQFVNWEMQRLGLGDKDILPTPVLDQVKARFGLEGIQVLLVAMGQTVSENEALRLALGVDLEDLNVVFEQYLEALLAVERQVMAWQRAEPVIQSYQSLPERIYSHLLATTFVDEWQDSRWKNNKEVMFQLWGNYPQMHFSDMPLSHPQVHWSELHDDWIWSEVSYSETVISFPYTLAPRRIEFFYWIKDGTWRHAPPDERFLGQKVVFTSEHLRIEGHEREESLITRLQTRLETRYRQISRDLQTSLPEGERLTIRLTTPDQTVHTPGNSILQLTSPFFTDLSSQHEGAAESQGFSFIFKRLAIQKAGGSHFVSGSRAIWFGAIADWYHAFAKDHLDSWTNFLWSQTLRSAVETGALVPLTDLWQGTSDRSSPDQAQLNLTELRHGQAWTAFHYLMETRGPDALPALVEALGQADSTASWLRQALDVEMETFEADWQAWLRQQLEK